MGNNRHRWSVDRDRDHLAVELIVMKIYCVGCADTVEARLTDGYEMYPHREDLHGLVFWICDTCGAFVGTHRTNNKPLGFLATPEIKIWRKNIHDILDPLWQKRLIRRGKLYAYISKRIGRTYHTAEIYSVDEGKRIYEVVKELKDSLDPGPWNQ